MYYLEDKLKEEIRKIVRENLEGILNNTLNEKKRANVVTERVKRLRPDFLLGNNMDKKKIAAVKFHIEALHNKKTVNDIQKNYAERLERACTDAVIEITGNNWIQKELKKQKNYEQFEITILNAWRSIMQELVKTRNAKEQDFTNGKILPANEVCRYVEKALFDFQSDGTLSVDYKYFCNPDLDFRNIYNIDKENQTCVEEESQNFSDTHWNNDAVCDFKILVDRFKNSDPIKDYDIQKIMVDSFFSYYKTFANEQEKRLRIENNKCARKLLGSNDYKTAIESYYQYYENNPEERDEYDKRYPAQLGAERHLRNGSKFYISYFAKNKNADVTKWIENRGDTKLYQFCKLLQDKMSLSLVLLLIGEIEREDYWYITGQIDSSMYEAWNRKITFEEYLDGYITEKLCTYCTKPLSYRTLLLNSKEERLQEDIRRIIIRNVFSPHIMKNWLLFSCLERLISENITFSDGYSGGNSNVPEFCVNIDMDMEDKIKTIQNDLKVFRFVRNKKQEYEKLSKTLTEDEAERKKNRLVEKARGYIVYEYQKQCFEFVTDPELELEINEYGFFSANNKKSSKHAFYNINIIFEKMREFGDDDFSPFSDYYLNQIMLMDSAVELAYGCMARLKRKKINVSEECFDSLLDRIVWLHNLIHVGAGKIVKECFERFAYEDLSDDKDISYFLEQFNAALSVEFFHNIGRESYYIREEFYRRLISMGQNSINDNWFQYRGELDYGINFYSNTKQLLEELETDEDKEAYIDRLKKSVYESNIRKSLNLLKNIWKKDVEVKNELLVSKEAWEYCEKYSETPEYKSRNKHSDFYKTIQGKLIYKNYNYRKSIK